MTDATDQRYLHMREVATLAERAWRERTGEDHYGAAVALTLYWVEWLTVYQPELAAAFYRSLADFSVSPSAQLTAGHLALARDGAALLKALRENRTTRQ